MMMILSRINRNYYDEANEENTELEEKTKITITNTSTTTT